LYEQSQYEFIEESQDKAPKLHVNMTFSNRGGVFFTPPEVAHFITQRTLAEPLNSDVSAVKEDHQCSRVLDPACGAGIFLLFAAREFQKKAKTGNQMIRDNLYGVDINPELVSLTKLCLGLFAGYRVAEIPGLGLNVKCGNTLVSNEPVGSIDGTNSLSRKQTATGIPKDLKTFDWFKEFPEIQSSGGFDYVLMNPPYGRLKVHYSDFTDRETSSRIKGEELRFAVLELRDTLGRLAKYFRECNDYEISIEGELDWYRLMLERAIRLLRPRGKLGCIVPASVLAGNRSRKMRRHLIERCKTFAYQLPETAKLFKTVNQPTCIMLTQKSIRSDRVCAVNDIKTAEDLWTTTPLSIDIDLVKRMSPELMPIPITNEVGFGILKKIHRFESIANMSDIENMRGELDLTACRKYVSNNSQGMRLIRGDHIERFVIRGAHESQKEGYVSRQFLDEVRNSSKMSHIRNRRVVGRQCSYMLKRRRLSFAICEKNVVVANSCNYITSNTERIPLEYLLGLLNSSIVEWRFRLTNSNNHVGNYELDQIPVPPFQKGNRLCRLVASVSNSLVSLYENQSFGLSSVPQLRKEDVLDAAVFRLFDLSDSEVAYVMDRLGEGSRARSILKEVNQLEGSICSLSTIT
jgi:Alw26I/Eco31I/Esp3I family type II restriction m6 adenine DNA methyltransferase